MKKHDSRRLKVTGTYHDSSVSVAVDHQSNKHMQLATQPYGPLSPPSESSLPRKNRRQTKAEIDHGNQKQKQHSADSPRVKDVAFRTDASCNNQNIDGVNTPDQMSILNSPRAVGAMPSLPKRRWNGVLRKSEVDATNEEESQKNYEGKDDTEVMNNNSLDGAYQAYRQSQCYDSDTEMQEGLVEESSEPNGPQNIGHDQGH